MLYKIKMILSVLSFMRNEESSKLTDDIAVTLFTLSEDRNLREISDNIYQYETLILH